MRLKSTLFGLLSSFVIIGLVSWQFQSISDWWILKNYTPPATVAKLAKDTTMKEGTKRLFYVNRPELDDKALFNTHCRESGEKTIVLGCFINGEGIYLLNVQDKRLKGVIEVTAAHEVLHAQYARLSGKDKARVDEMTKKAFVKVDDKRIKSVIAQYNSKDPSSVPSELHSILGTEVESLPKDLEQYYGQYFSDRSKIVDFSKHYEQAFVDIDNQVKNYDVTLDALRSEINQLEANLKNQNSNIESERNRLDSLLSNDQTQEYNEGVPAFNQMIRDYNATIRKAESTINHYNDIVNKRNNLASTQSELIKELDSTQLSPMKR